MFGRIARVLPFILIVYLSLPVISAFMAVKSISAIGREEVLAAFAVSISSATLTTTISAIFGIPLAYKLARNPGRVAQIAEAIVISPVVLPPLVTGLFLLSVLSPAGFIGRVAENAGIEITRTFLAVVLAQLAVASPFTVISAKAAFEEIDPKLEFASRLMGAGNLRTFLRVSLPLAKRGIIAGLLMTFVRSVGEFGATFMLAYFPKTLPVYLYTSYLRGGVEEAAPVALLLLLIGLLVFAVLRAVGDGFAGTERSK